MSSSGWLANKPLRRLSCLALLLLPAGCRTPEAPVAPISSVTSPVPVIPEGFTGAWTLYSPDGRIASVRELRDGVESGAVTEYYENGNVREQYTRIDGKLQGQYLQVSCTESRDYASLP